MVKKTQILVIGHNDKGCTPEHEKIAFEIGKEVAKSGCVLITGGLGGVMKAASRGSQEASGLSVGIIPQNEASFANEFCDVVIPSGLGLARDFLTALASDGVIVVGGGAGTLSEMCAAYMHKKPIVAIRGSGGMAERFIDGFIDHREIVKIIGVDNPKDAVKKILELLHGS